MAASSDSCEIQPQENEITELLNYDIENFVLATNRKDKIPTSYGSTINYFIELVTKLVDLTEDESVTQMAIYNSNVHDICKNTRFNILLDILPDADTDFLRMKIDKIQSEDEFQLFVATSFELKNYPKNALFGNKVIRDIPEAITHGNPISVVSEQRLSNKPVDRSVMGPSSSTANSSLAPHTATSTNDVNNVETLTSVPLTIDEGQRYKLLVGILCFADRELLRKEVKKMKNDEDVEKFLVESILNEKLWNRYVSDQPTEDTSPKSLSRHSDSKLKILVALFPDASAGYLKYESTKTKTDKELDEFVMQLGLEQIYTQRKITHLHSKNNKRKVPRDPEQINPKYLTLLEMLPDADPDYLLEQSKSLPNDDELQLFILNAVEENSFPKRDQFVERQEYQKQWKKYIENFDIRQYLKVIPNPVKYYYIDKDNSKNPSEMSVQFLQDRYRRKNGYELDVVYKSCKNNLTKTCDQLDKRFRIKPSEYTSWDQKTIFSTAVLQEIAFIQNKKEIAHFIVLRDKLKIIAYEKAKSEGALLECTCCYEEKLPEDMSSCRAGHVYCLDCIKRGSEVVIGNGDTTFPCYTDDCKEEFSLTVLKSVLNAEVFSRALTRKQYADVIAADVSGLETCSFCEFCAIPPPEDKLFHCLNPSCMKITCRFCRKLDHLPIKCKELVKVDKQKEMLSYVENKMTEALVRTCWKCARKFVKESGCNLMTCKCGAKMCYLCRQPVQNYSHFGNGRCGQYFDVSKLDEAAVLNVGKKAKMEVENANPGLQVSLDPSELLNRS